MRSGIKFRLAALGVAMTLMGLSIVVVTLLLQRRAESVREQLGEVDLESYRIADLFKVKLRQANDLMRRHSTDENPEAWAEFLKSEEELRGWIDGETGRLTTPREQELLKQMLAASDAYLQKARELHTVMVTNQSRIGASVGEFNGFLDQARRFMDLSQELSRSHFNSRNDALSQTHQTLTELRLAVLVLVALLFVFGVVLAGTVYRNLIAPLRLKLVESQLLAERNEKLASLGLLAAGVAHEIRNPLTAIKTALFLQQKKFPPGSPGYENGQVVEAEISRLERIVNTFLQFARPPEPELETVQADAPLQEVQALLAPELAKADIQLIQESCAPMQIQVDGPQIRQVLINLVKNAADSIGHSGKIILRARAGRKALAKKDAEVVILEVADTGKGIPLEVQPRLFDPFFTTKDGGTGLGLAIAARVVERNGGTLQFQSQINRGSTFGIVLPRVKSAGQTVTPEIGAPMKANAVPNA